MVIKQTPAPMFNWDLPNVEMPEGDDTPVLSAEQWVVWFRTLPTAAQIEAAKSIMELQNELQDHFNMDTTGRLGRAEDTVESLRDALRGIKDGLRSILEQTKGVKPSKKRAALLAERITAIGVSIKGMGL